MGMGNGFAAIDCRVIHHFHFTSGVGRRANNVATTDTIVCKVHNFPPVFFFFVFMPGKCFLAYLESPHYQ